MTFEKGNPGRPKGAISRFSRQVEEITTRLQVDPLEILLLFAKGDWETLGYDTGVIIKESQSGEGGTFMEYTISPELRAQCAAKACEYVYPKKKSIEVKQANALDEMSAQEKLAMMKQAIQVLEGEIDARPVEQAVITDGLKENT